jgi:HPt (histidine-containing phosphotransfer) domain-containing protein
MAKTIPAILVALAVGAAVGVLVERRRRGSAEDAPASAPPDGAADEGSDGDGEGAGGAALEEELARAKERIRSLKAELAALKAANAPEEDPESAKSRARALRAKIPELVEKQDGAGLLALMKELGALGEPGFKGAMEIAEILRKAFGNGDEAFGIARVQFNKAFGALTPLMTWALANPGEASGWFRGHAVHMLFWLSDVDAAPIFLDALAKEQNPGIAQAMAGYLERLAKPGMATDLEEAARAHSDRPQTFQPLLQALVDMHSPESAASLRALAGEANPQLRAAAELALVEHSPPAAGIMITTTRPKSQAETVGLQKGDILVSYDGKEIKSLDELRKSVQQKPDKELVTVMVNRNGSLVPVQITGNWIGIDGKYVKP